MNWLFIVAFFLSVLAVCFTAWDVLRRFVDRKYPNLSEVVDSLRAENDELSARLERTVVSRLDAIEADAKEHQARVANEVRAIAEGKALAANLRSQRKHVKMTGGR